jgi:hypothetical protein
MEFSELDEEVSRLRVRKSELEDIISHSASSCGTKLDSAKPLNFCKRQIEEHESDEG